MPSEEVVRCERVVKTYRTPSGEVRALRGVDASFPEAALVAVAGPSGSGKSSLLRLIAGMDRPTSGTVIVAGESIGSASTHRRRRLRRERVGYVFQRPSDNFLAHLTVGEHLERVAAPDADVAGVLDALGISARVAHRPGELSGGEQQRAAFAQALVSGARVVVADEPTAELDTESAARVLDAFESVNREFGVTIVMVTHDLVAARRAKRQVRLRDGQLVVEGQPADPVGTDGRLRLPDDAIDAIAGSDLEVDVRDGEVRIRRRGEGGLTGG